jgi:NAD(P)-dependent dehydrogenase (short-subunit alcohol dehydrogenase family)
MPTPPSHPGPAGTAIVTGATSGLGFECARALLDRNPSLHVVLAVRDPNRGSEAAERLGYAERCVVSRLDLASLASVREFVTWHRDAQLPPTRALICNAGVQVVSELGSTEDGYELTFGVNHLGHFALVEGLLDQLARPSRIVLVSSATHDPANRTGMPKPLYTSAEQLAHARPAADEDIARFGRRLYTTSKLCNVLFAYELDRRLRHEGHRATVNAFDPGLMPGSGLARDYSPAQRFAWRFALPLLRVLPHVHSARTSGRDLAALADDALFDEVSGRYFIGQRAARSSVDSYDLDKAVDLWHTSELLIRASGRSAA